MSRKPTTTVCATIAAIAMAITVAFVPHLAVAQDDAETGPTDDTVYAQVLPLATKSLMLDITRMAGGRFVAVGERGHVIHSDDGELWVQATSVPSRATLTSVTTAGDRLWAGGHDTDILVSDDRGETWTLLYRDIERQQPVLDLHFFDARRGMAIGAYGLAMFTDDGGESWDERVVSEDEWHLNAVLDRGDGQLFIAGESGISYASDDSGLSWEALEMPYPGSMFGALESGGCLWLFGLRGHLQRRCGEGSDWDEPETDSMATLLDGIATDEGLLLVGNSGTVILGRPGAGAQVFQHSSGVDFAGVVALGDGRWLLAGEGGVHHFPETGVSP